MKQSTEDLIFERLRRLEGDTSTPQEKIIFEKLRELSARTDKIEQWQWKLTGIVLACGFLFSAAVSLLGVFYGK